MAWEGIEHRFLSIVMVFFRSPSRFSLILMNLHVFLKIRLAALVETFARFQAGFLSSGDFPVHLLRQVSPITYAAFLFVIHQVCICLVINSPSDLLAHTSASSCMLWKRAQADIQYLMAQPQS